MKYDLNINNMNSRELITFIKMLLNNLPQDKYFVYNQKLLNCGNDVSKLRSLAKQLDR